MNEKANAPRTSINVRVEEDLLNEGKALAKKRGGNLSTLLRGLLIAEIEREKAKTS